MATLNVSLPDPMKDWVAAQITGGRYASSSDYIRDLIRRDQECREKRQALQEAITKGLESGISERSVSEIIDEAKRELKAE